MGVSDTIEMPTREHYSRLWRAVRAARGWRVSDLPDNRMCNRAEEGAFSSWIRRNTVEWEGLELTHRREIRNRWTNYREMVRKVPR